VGRSPRMVSKNRDKWSGDPIQRHTLPASPGLNGQGAEETISAHLEVVKTVSKATVSMMRRAGAGGHVCVRLGSPPAIPHPRCHAADRARGELGTGGVPREPVSGATRRRSTTLS
jgi:hypothetical protein